MTDKTKENILTATIGYIKENGKIPSVRELSKISNTNIALINYHFGKKTALITKAINTIVKEAYLSWVKTNIEGKDITIELIEKYIAFLIESLLANRSFSSVRIHSLLDSNEKDWLSEEIVIQVWKLLLGLKKYSEEEANKKSKDVLIYLLGINVILSQPSESTLIKTEKTTKDSYIKHIMEFIIL